MLTGGLPNGGAECRAVLCRDMRLRQYYGQRYDARANLADWDYFMKLREWVRAGGCRFSRRGEGRGRRMGGTVREVGDQTTWRWGHNLPMTTVSSHCMRVLIRHPARALGSFFRDFHLAEAPHQLSTRQCTPALGTARAFVLSIVLGLGGKKSAEDIRNGKGSFASPFVRAVLSRPSPLLPSRGRAVPPYPRPSSGASVCTGTPSSCARAATRRQTSPWQLSSTGSWYVAHAQVDKDRASHILDMADLGLTRCGLASSRGRRELRAAEALSPMLTLCGGGGGVLLSLYCRQGGVPTAYRGFWGDIVTGPFAAFGLTSDNPDMQKTVNDKFVYVCRPLVTQRNPHPCLRRKHGKADASRLHA